MFLALVGAAGIAGYRFLSGYLGGGHPPRARARHSQRTTTERDLGNLEWDEGAGVYRPTTKRER
jgi:hypothetical protein